MGAAMDLAYFFGRAWEFIKWFADLVVGTVADSIFGGWNAVIALALFAVVFFVLTRTLVRRRED